MATDAGAKAEPGAVRVDGESLDHPGPLLLVLHKPVGLVCSHDPGEGPSVYGLLPERWRKRNPQVVSVGRLDKDTSGLLLLTDQAALVHRLTSPRHKVPKVYLATLDRELPDAAETVLASGTLMLDGESEPCAPATLRRLSALQVELTLTEGRYHQVRRMIACLGSTVILLHRSHFGHLDLEGLPAGSFREIPASTFDSSRES